VGIIGVWGVFSPSIGPALRDEAGASQAAAVEVGNSLRSPPPEVVSVAKGTREDRKGRVLWPPLICTSSTPLLKFVSTFFYEPSMTFHARALSSKNLLPTPADFGEDGNEECSVD
jgi:hypothetical protein